jgi:hypothetical protein
MSIRLGATRLPRFSVQYSKSSKLFLCFMSAR